MQLSKNFHLREFLISQTAVRHGIDMTPPDSVIANLAELVDSNLQPLRDELGVPINITSGYRPRVLNALIGGSRNSAHIDGRAVDFQIHDMRPLKICRVVRALKLPFDQLINEFGLWVHLGIGPNPRGQTLTAYRDAGRVRYQIGLVDVDGLRWNA